jgi:hypothetical protein
MSPKARWLLAAAIVVVCVLIVVGPALKRHRGLEITFTQRNPFDLIFANIKFNGNRLDVQEGKVLSLYNRTTPTLSEPTVYNLSVYPQAFCSGTHYAWLTDNKGILIMLDLGTGNTEDFRVPVTQAVLSCDATGSTAVFGGWSGDVAICKPLGLAWVRHDPTDSILAASVSGDGRYCACGAQEHVYVWNANTRKLLFDKKDWVDMGCLSWDPSVNCFWDTNEVQNMRQIDPSKKDPMGKNIQVSQTMDGPYKPQVLKRQSILLFTLIPTRTEPPPSATGGHLTITIDPDNMGYQTICRVHGKTVFKKQTLSPSCALRADGKEFAYFSDKGAITVVPIPAK